MGFVEELNNEDSKRKKFQVLKNVSCDPRAIAVIPVIAYFVMTQTQGCLYRSEVLLFGYINLERKSFLAIENISEVHFQGCGK